MIKSLFYFILLLIGIPVGFLLSKLCNDEIKNWRFRLKLIAVVCVFLMTGLFFSNFVYRVPVIVSLFFVIIVCEVVILKSK